MNLFFLLLFYVKLIAANN